MTATYVGLTKGAAKARISNSAFKGYLLDFSGYLDFCKTGKRYTVNVDSLPIIQKVHELYAEGKDKEEIIVELEKDKSSEVGIQAVPSLSEDRTFTRGELLLLAEAGELVDGTTFICDSSRRVATFRAVEGNFYNKDDRRMQLKVAKVPERYRMIEKLRPIRFSGELPPSEIARLNELLSNNGFDFGTTH